MLLSIAVSAFAQTPASDSGVAVRWSLHESDMFMYRVNMSTEVKRYFPHSDLPSEYKRQLTYWLIVHVVTVGKDGIVTFEANIDSMRIHTDKAGDELTFDSQDFHATETVNLSHPELVGPSMILNKPFTFRMTLEGDFIDLQGFEGWIGQIDSAVTLDSTVRTNMKEYMAPEFLRRLVTPAEGFVYGRRYAMRDTWNQAVPRSVFTIPVMDSARYKIEIPSTKKRFFIYSDGRLFPRAKEIRDHGFKETAMVDSVRGTMTDTVLLAGRGHIEDLQRTATMRAYLHTAQLAYSEDIKETTIVRLEAYERR